MKNLVALFAMVIISVTTFSQAPQMFAFQSTLTDSLGNPLCNQVIDVKFNISGSVFYEEVHEDVMTSASGYFSLNVGGGIPVSGSFATIDWGNAAHYLDILVDTTGAGTDFIPLGSSQLLSVPYALYSASAASVTAPGLPSTFSATLGTSYVGTSDTIGFDNIIINVGNDYNPITGVYTVPADGIYLIKVIGTGGTGNTSLIAGSVTVTQLGAFNYDEPFQLTAGETVRVESDDFSNGSTFKIIQLR